MSAMRMVAGMSAEGALPKADIPAGRERTPAPTMHLTRLKISSGMVAVPSTELLLLLGSVCASEEEEDNWLKGLCWLGDFW